MTIFCGRDLEEFCGPFYGMGVVTGLGKLVGPLTLHSACDWLGGIAAVQHTARKISIVSKAHAVSNYSKCAAIEHTGEFLPAQSCVVPPTFVAIAA